MSEGEDPFCGLTTEIGGAVGGPRALADGADADPLVPAAMRAVPEHRARFGPSAVPAIARTASVSRLHLGNPAGALLAGVLARFAPNQAATEAGAAVLATIHRRDGRVRARLEGGTDTGRCAEQAETVAALRKALAALGQG